MRVHACNVEFLCRLQENSDKSVIELQQYAKKNKPNLHILNKLREEMMKLARERVHLRIWQLPAKSYTSDKLSWLQIKTILFGWVDAL